MPELPEVETYARDLSRHLPGRTFVGAKVDWPNQVPRNRPEALDARLAGQSITAVTRRGKYLVLSLSEDVLLIHLKMSGRLQLALPGSALNPHAHVVFFLRGGDELRFHDPRKFGRVYLMADPAPILGVLGPEPLAPEFDVAALAARLARRGARLKSLLLDQTVIAGLGNIYVDESLWAAGLHPLRKADSLVPEDQARLYAGIRDVLSRAVGARGTSLSDSAYIDFAGNRGEFQDRLAVYGRAGLPCRRCAGTVIRIVVGGRGTHLCPSCQAAP